MKLGYTIVYVPDVTASLVFFESAFGLKRGFLHEAGDYGELNTGATTLAFASHALGDSNFAAGVVRASESDKPLGMESPWSPTMSRRHIRQPSRPAPSN